MKIFNEIFKWLARLISVSVLGFVMLSVFTELPDVFQLSSTEVILFVPLISLLVGFILAWFKPMVGGAISFVSAMLFMILSQTANEATYYILFGACLFLLHGILTKIIEAELNE